MTIVDELTPVYYRLTRIGVIKQAGEVLAIADLRILNANGRELDSDNPVATLTPAEKTTLNTFVTRELAAYETATGLTEWPG